MSARDVDGPAAEGAATPAMTITAAVAVDAHRLHLAVTFDETADYSAHTRLLHYDGSGAAPVWTAHDVGFFTVGLERDVDDAGQPVLAALSLDGEVERWSPAGSVIERIPEAGLRQPTSKGWGFLTRLRRAGGRLHACGAAGQVYARQGPAQWVHADAGLLQAPDVDLEDALRVMDVQGPAEDDLYAAVHGLGPRGLVGGLHHRGAAGWRRLSTPPIGGLNAVHVESEALVIACGHEGALLAGNHRDGFEDWSRERSPQLYHAVTVHDGAVLLGSNFGLFRYDREARRPVRVRTGLDVELRYVHTIERQGDVLWCAGPTDLARFDGRSWARLALPGGALAARPVS